MDALEICGGHLVESLVWANTWFWFGPGGVEVEIQIIKTASGNQEVVFNKHLNWDVKGQLTKAVQNDGGYRTLALQKEERKGVQIGGGPKHRVA